MSRMKDKYRNEVIAALKERGEYNNVMENQGNADFLLAEIKHKLNVYY